ncbi:dihydrolipoamide acetyltransferase family protein [Leifsonia shinshuensis]|uniref:Dihydrolipoamide acetyltransferase component of pyruvate dehydrogenase complex n=4 Tax=root TaxID=1 RepID=A0A853CXH0_9MICO|nr:dihydrolipoamide acetyltransferase family protein [Leifsonia shinshuensis]NYJ24613.1 pyruvate dehydrogenase E2 component (dihydrolipoamide acetyltransferase) [Leifsonia shinshuensis]
MAVKDFALPDLGEGLTESELVSWHVAVGDTVRLNQIIAEVETAKALVELPAPYEGTVSRLYVEPGVTVAVGEPLVAFEVAGPAGAEPGAPAAAPSEDAGSAETREPVLVGYGARPDAKGRPARRARPGLAAQPAASQSVAVQPAASGQVASAPAASGQAASASVAAHSAPAVSVSAAPSAAASDTAVPERPRATPPVRKLARERGIDLAAVTGTGDRGLVTRADLDAFETAAAAPAAVAPAGSTPDELRIPIKGVRKATADAMVRSAFGAPQATVFLTVDITPTTELIERLRARPDLADARPGLLAVVAKALCLAARRTPEVNSKWDEAAQEIVQTRAINLGIAAATPRGLLVPVIRDADGHSLAELSGAIRDLAVTARSGKTPPSALTGGTITITNVGVFGVDAGTPILTPGEAAILAVGAVRRQPWEHHGEIALRDVLTLALTFDHRIVDGEQGSRFLADIGRILADPASVLTLV